MCDAGCDRNTVRGRDLQPAAIGPPPKCMIDACSTWQDKMHTGITPGGHKSPGLRKSHSGCKSIADSGLMPKAGDCCLRHLPFPHAKEGGLDYLERWRIFLRLRLRRRIRFFLHCKERGASVSEVNASRTPPPIRTTDHAEWAHLGAHFDGFRGRVGSGVLKYVTAGIEGSERLVSLLGRASAGADKLS